VTPYERLMAEAVPTGTFGRARPTTQQWADTAPAWTAEEQAAHLRTLNAALDGWQDHSDRAEQDRNRHRPPHLRLVHPTAA
jgi:hypothetical protein